MAWSGQFSDFDNFVLPNARGNIQDSKPRSTKPHNIQSSVSGQIIWDSAMPMRQWVGFVLQQCLNILNLYLQV
jgi:hypothetical protein